MQQFGTTAEDQNMMAEESRQSRRVVMPGSEDLAAIPVQDAEELSVDDGEGGSMSLFIFGLHDPLDLRVQRWFPGG